eukprot:TRINITY_DN655_c0_g1_i1.p1 TRINITY_DN655_c0_g1~~TRINITY_DN655_c0_g1_i1.p1  ORF type:complete len:180 (+),score=36.93 TRINITY_DN655_c0_g1_i1:89-628(+)
MRTGAEVAAADLDDRRIIDRSSGKSLLIDYSVSLSTAASQLSEFKHVRDGLQELAEVFDTYTLNDILDATEKTWEELISVCDQDQRQKVRLLKLAVQRMNTLQPWMNATVEKKIMVQPHDLPPVCISIFSTMQLEREFGKWKTTRLILENSPEQHDTNNHVALTYSELVDNALYKVDNA